MSNTFLKWLLGIIISIPTEIVTGLIIGFIVLILSKVFIKFKILGNSIQKIIKSIFKSNIEISLSTEFIDSPEYAYKPKREIYKKVSKNTATEDDILLWIVGLPIVGAIIVQNFVKNVKIISDILKWMGIIPLGIFVILLFVIALYKKVHKITIKFMIYSFFISALTIYYGVNLINISKGMTYELSNIQGMAMSIYKILGIFIAVIQQLLSYYLLVRVIFVYIDYKSKKNSNFVKRFIAKTVYLESNVKMLFLIILFSTLSYLLTSGWLYNIIININS